MKRRIGIFGGTFNPPHVGHVEAAKSFLQQAKLDEMITLVLDTVVKLNEK